MEKISKRKREIVEKLSEFFNRDFNEGEINEELLTLTLRANEFYSKTIKKYLKTVAVIEFNIIRYIKEHSKEFNSRADMNNFVLNAINELKSRKNMTRTEEIELRTLIRFKEQVLGGKGKEYDITKGFKFDFDDQEVEYEPMQMGEGKE